MSNISEHILFSPALFCFEDKVCENVNDFKMTAAATFFSYIHVDTWRVMKKKTMMTLMKHRCYRGVISIAFDIRLLICSFNNPMSSFGDDEQESKEEFR